MAEGNGRTRIGAAARGAAFGEALRRFMLRPEATALAAVVVLFIIFTILSPKLFPDQATYSA